MHHTGAPWQFWLEKDWICLTRVTGTFQNPLIWKMICPMKRPFGVYHGIFIQNPGWWMVSWFVFETPIVFPSLAATIVAITSHMCRCISWKKAGKKIYIYSKSKKYPTIHLTSGDGNQSAMVSSQQFACGLAVPGHNSMSELFAELGDWRLSVDMAQQQHDDVTATWKQWAFRSAAGVVILCHFIWVISTNFTTRHGKWRYGWGIAAITIYTHGDFTPKRWGITSYYQPVPRLAIGFP